MRVLVLLALAVSLSGCSVTERRLIAKGDERYLRVATVLCLFSSCVGTIESIAAESDVIYVRCFAANCKSLPASQKLPPASESSP